MEKFDLYFFEEHYVDGASTVRMQDGRTVIMTEREEDYAVFDMPPLPEMVCGVKLFYGDSLLLKQEGKLLRHGNMRIGVWKKYDEFGTLTEEKDMDADCPFKWEQVRNLMEQERIPVDQLTEIFRKWNDDGSVEWRLTLVPARRTQEIIRIDGKTGAILSRDRQKVKIQP